MQDCSLNGIALIQIAPPFLIMSEFTLCTNLPQSTISKIYTRPFFNWLINQLNHKYQHLLLIIGLISPTK